MIDTKKNQPSTKPSKYKKIVKKNSSCQINLHIHDFQKRGKEVGKNHSKRREEVGEGLQKLK